LGAFFLRNSLNLTLLNFIRSLNNLIFFFILPTLVMQSFLSASPAGPLDEGFTGTSPGVILGGSSPAGPLDEGFTGTSPGVILGGSAGFVSPWW
jgi:hypothetical protein